VVPTDGDPAIVGSGWFRLRSDASDCFCIELTVCEVTRDVDGVRVMVDAGVDAEELFFKLATR
jgi:predicted deacylase